ncbi:uncharacterized protein EDB91DRAFT_1141018 [Suillus paluster]|uniref:uncharacterized protein n=1 Tax=Suillus paluster TaxID=48578 RepID=UPI001B883C01|nr:uncharacterized protein EDB91DRAFT_1141018 [Suillus paluster]KAG1737101.1 hypothetical protein EDB91DRAFT_1141018 [Suillus paluster]
MYIKISKSRRRCLLSLLSFMFRRSCPIYIRLAQFHGDQDWKRLFAFWEVKYANTAHRPVYKEELKPVREAKALLVNRSLEFDLVEALPAALPQPTSAHTDEGNSTLPDSRPLFMRLGMKYSMIMAE